VAELRPLLMPDNRVPVFYEGGAQIDRFRAEPGDHSGPEDWVASLNRLPRSSLADGVSLDTGISRTTDGHSLRDLVDQDPHGWLGGSVADKYGGASGLLVKILDAGERLPVHCHPTRPFAAAHLGSVFGKTEGWIIMGAAPGAKVWLGMGEAVPTATMRRWVESQDVAAMLAVMNEIPAVRGQVFFVRAGLPHSIGPGVMLTELQEPTSFSIFGEYESFGLDEQRATLGLGWDLAISCFDLGEYRGDRLEELLPDRALRSQQSGGTVHDLFAPEADRFFSAVLVNSSDSVELQQQSFSVLVVTEGAGELHWDGGVESVRRGETWVVPFGAGMLSFVGELEVIVCLPPGD